MFSKSLLVGLLAGAASALRKFISKFIGVASRLTEITTATISTAAAGPGTTLIDGYYWVRAVTAPNFHKYMQSAPLLGTGAVVLESHTTAGQLQIVEGQLVQLISDPGAPEAFLYAAVSKERTHGDRKFYPL